MKTTTVRVINWENVVPTIAFGLWFIITGFIGKLVDISRIVDPNHAWPMQDWFWGAGIIGIVVPALIFLICAFIFVVAHWVVIGFRDTFTKEIEVVEE